MGKKTTHQKKVDRQRRKAEKRRHGALRPGAAPEAKRHPLYYDRVRPAALCAVVESIVSRGGRLIAVMSPHRGTPRSDGRDVCVLATAPTCDCCPPARSAANVGEMLKVLRAWMAAGAVRRGDVFTSDPAILDEVLDAQTP